MYCHSLMIKGPLCEIQLKAPPSQASIMPSLTFTDMRWAFIFEMWVLNLVRKHWFLIIFIVFPFFSFSLFISSSSQCFFSDSCCHFKNVCYWVLCGTDKGNYTLIIANSSPKILPSGPLIFTKHLLFNLYKTPIIVLFISGINMHPAFRTQVGSSMCRCEKGQMRPTDRLRSNDFIHI